MPENEFPENIHNFFEQENSSQGRQSQVGSGGWPIFNNNPWVGSQRPNGAPLAFTKNYMSHSLDSGQGNGMQPVQTPFGSNPNLKPELIRNQPGNQQISLNGYMHSPQGATNFQGDGLVSDGNSLMQRGFSNSTFEPQQSSTPRYISGLTRSSESSGAAEAPVNFDFLGGQQLMRSPHPGISYPHPIQPQRIHDLQLWQQQMMYKQLKEMQRNQQLQQLQQQGGKQQISQASNNEIPTVLSGMPIHNNSNNIWSNEHGGSEGRLPSSSPMLISRMPMQGIPNGLMFSRDQGQAVRSMGFTLQQPDQSLYGTPVGSTKGSLIHESQFEPTNQSEKGSMQTPAFNHFQNNQPVDIRQGYVHDDISGSKHGLGVSRGATSGNIQHMGQFSQSVQIQEMSGSLHEKAGGQVGLSRRVADLDPTEEKQLFSGDDQGGLMQSNNYLSEFPTLNSGSWSALMQEAVEASSSDTGLNEEWSSLSFQKTELSPGNHSSMLPNNNANFQNASSLSSRPLPLFNEGNGMPNCHSDKPFDQSHQQKQAGGIVQAQTQFNNNNLNGVWTGQMSEQLASSSHSPDSSHNMKHAWPQHQSVPFQGHPANLLNTWNNQSLGATGGNDSKSYDDNDVRSTVNMEGHKGSMWMVTGNQVPTFLPNSAGRRAIFGSDTGSLMQNDDSGASNLASIMNSNNLNMNQETNQQIFSRHQVNYKKHAVDTYPDSKKDKTTNKYQNQRSGTPPSWDASMYTDKQENNQQEEGLNEGFASNSSQPGQNSDVGSNAREKSILAGNEVQPLVNSGLKSSGQTGRENMGPRRFQFHPMGNLEMSAEPMGSQSHASYPQGLSQSAVQGLKNQERGYSAQSQFAGHVLNNFMDIGKGQSSDLKRNIEAMEGIQYRDTFSSNPATPVDGSASQFSQNKRTGPTSQNMLELLHKVDQSRVGKTFERFGVSERSTPSGGAEGDASDGSSANLQLNQSSALQGFGLKLGPPSQRQSLSNDFNQKNLDLGTREENQTRASFSSVHDVSEKEKSSNNGSFLSGHKSKEAKYSAAANNLRINQSIMQQQQQMHFPFASGPNRKDQLAQIPFGTHVGIDDKKGQDSQNEDKPDQSAITGGIHRSRLIPSVSKLNPGKGQSQHVNSSSRLGNSGQQNGFSTMLHNVWTSVSSQQRASGVHPQNIISNVLQCMSPSSAGKEMSEPAPQKPDNPNKRKGESPSNSDHNSTQLPQPDLDPKRGSVLSQGTKQESEHKDYSDKSKGKYTQDSSVDLPKGQVPRSSIAPSNCDPPESTEVHNQNNYSLLQQIQGMKNVDSDPTRRDAKRLKVADSGTDSSARKCMYEQNTATREMDAASQNIPHPPDFKMLSFSSRDSKENSANTSLQQHDLRNHSQPHGKNSFLPHISPQMPPPSWFEKYGNYKNSQILTYDGLGSSRRSAMAADPNNALSKVSESMVSKDDVASATNCAADNADTSPSHPSLELVVNNNVSLTPKKRKSATSDLFPWHKSVTEGCRRLQSISISELQWARATNRLIDKLDDAPDLIKNGPSRSRRRLTLTTQLVKHILPSIPATYLSGDAATSYESVIFFMAKSVLGEACSLTCSESDSRVDSDGGDMSSEKLITYRKEGSSHFSRFVEDVIGRLKKSEDDFLRLEKTTYMLDRRLESQELERFSIVNRFAKLHLQVQSEGGGEGSSSTSDPNPRRLFPQRHVTVHAMPRNLPEDVNCFSL